MSFTLRPFKTYTRDTKFGAIRIEESRPNEAFWNAWRNDKHSLKKMGFNVFKRQDEFFVKRYVTVSPPQPPASEFSCGYEIQNTSILYEEQIISANHLCAALLKHRAALDASDPGTGKSYTALLGVARELKLPFAIICLNTAVEMWARLCNKYKARPLFIANWEGCRTKGFKFGSFESPGKYAWKIPKDTLLIFDEAHKAMGIDTLNAYMMIAGRGHLPLMLSATLASKPSQLKAAGYLLRLHNLTDFKKFCSDYDTYEAADKGMESANPADAMRKLSELIFPDKGYRIRYADLGDKFPKTVITADLYDIGETAAHAQNDAFQKMKTMVSDLIHEIKELKKRLATLKDEVAAGADPAAYEALLTTMREKQAKAMTLNLRYRQEAELLKVPLLLELAAEGRENGQSVALFTNFNETLFQIQKALKCPAVYGGNVKTKHVDERQRAIDDFQSGAAREIVLNVKAGGASISLHDLDGRFPRLALICPTYDEKDLKQVLGRVHRAEGKSVSQQRLIYANGTVEVDVARSVSEKLAALSALNDGDLMELDILNLLPQEPQDESPILFEPTADTNSTPA